MPSDRVKWALTTLPMLASVCLVALPPSSGETRPAARPDRNQLVQRIQELQPTAKERRFEAIGWVSGIREAERLARASGRPVFLFSNVGQMDIGRC